MKTMKLMFAVVGAILVVGCGGGGGSSTPAASTTQMQIQPQTQPQIYFARANSPEAQELRVRAAAEGSQVVEEDGRVTVTLTLTHAQHAAVRSLLSMIESQSPSPTPQSPPITGRTLPPTLTGNNCYLEYEHGRYEYDCDDDYRVPLNLLPGDTNPNVRCYYERDDGRLEYECEDDRYEGFLPPTNSEPNNVGRPPTLPTGYTLIGCEFEGGNEYECYYRNGNQVWECEYEHGRWQRCENEYEYRQQNYYRLDVTNDPWAENDFASSVRGHIQNGVAVNIKGYERFSDFRFASDATLQFVHLEHRLPMLVERDGFSVSGDWGFLQESDTATRVHYAKVGGLYSVTPQLDMYMNYSLGRVGSDYYQPTVVRGYSAGVFWHDFSPADIDLHFGVGRDLSADEIAENEFGFDVRIGDDANHWRFGYSRDVGLRRRPEMQVRFVREF